MKNVKKVFVVHAVDAEGPLYESPKATFERANELLNLKIKDYSSTNLAKLKKGHGFSGKLKQKIQKIFSSHLTNYNTNWFKIKKMLKKISSKKFRKSITDDDKKEYIYFDLALC